MAAAPPATRPKMLAPIAVAAPVNTATDAVEVPDTSTAAVAYMVKFDAPVAEATGASISATAAAVLVAVAMMDEADAIATTPAGTVTVTVADELFSPQQPQTVS